uniref:Uncharacterized protein n=1 Tax=Arundo donax TaxID=35708 RepID=A0A0A9HB95_ARUDO
MRFFFHLAPNLHSQFALQIGRPHS